MTCTLVGLNPIVRVVGREFPRFDFSEAALREYMALKDDVNVSLETRKAVPQLVSLLEQSINGGVAESIVEGMDASVEGLRAALNAAYPGLQDVEQPVRQL